MHKHDCVSVRSSLVRMFGGSIFETRRTHVSFASTLRVASSRRYKWLNLAATDKQERGRWNPRAGYNTLSLIGTFAMRTVPLLNIALLFCAALILLSPSSPGTIRGDIIARMPEFESDSTFDILQEIKSSGVFAVNLSKVASLLLIVSLNEHF